ncbi:Zinc/iron permease [Mycena epipterygia]|nr:Zinc/iron permease [Mycena epipterygia]
MTRQYQEQGLHASLTLVSTAPPNEKIAAIFSIFVVSLLAVGFPAASKRYSFLRIPHVAFFIGKHFGTGVILSTAFCHLLQDAFENLQSPVVDKVYPKIGQQTGFIIMSSLLLIFVVEYIATSYVDFLDSDPSVRALSTDSDARTIREPTETTPLVVSFRHSSASFPSSYLATTRSPTRHGTLSRHEGRVLSSYVTTDADADAFLSEVGIEGDFEQRADALKIVRGRQLVGIMVLELGILLHSLVIGLTLALTSGGDFTSLLTAIIFHQLFEGLSLGIRIAALPDAKARRDWFSTTLSLLFALTTPVGLALGLRVFAPGAQAQASSLLIKGLMSAVSAGMLIYAATVEMIAADFVFGNLEDGHGHSHSHEVAGDGGEENMDKRPDTARRVLAVGSLLAGVGSMVLVSLGE